MILARLTGFGPMLYFVSPGLNRYRGIQGTLTSGTGPLTNITYRSDLTATGRPHQAPRAILAPSVLPIKGAGGRTVGGLALNSPVPVVWIRQSEVPID